VGDQWKPVDAGGAYTVEVNKYNVVAFKPVIATAVRLEVTSQKTFSSGVIEWKVK
jgi:hypothetical protein